MFLDIAPADGPVAIVSQSGIMSAVPYGLLRRQNIGVRYAHATGNDADISLPELTLAVLHDEAVRLVLLYIEALRDVETLTRAAALARKRDVPIVAVKAGRTERGQAAAKSHTGALANEDRVVAEFLRSEGIWRANDIHELVRAAPLYLKDWRPRGRRLVVVSNSGAMGVMAADTAHDLDLPLATFDAETTAALDAALPVFATTTNPIDVTAALLTNSALLGGVLSVLTERSDGDLFLIGLPVAGPGCDVAAFARDAATFAERTGKPIVVAAPQASVAAPFHDAGVPTYANQTDALHAFAQLVGHVQLMRRTRTTRHAGAPVDVTPGTGRFFNEADSLALLRERGLPVVRYRLCRSETEARAAFRDLGPAVAVKACSADLPHKPEHGLVQINMRDEAEVAVAFASQMARMDAFGATIDGVIVAQMCRGTREFVLGARTDPAFGPVVMIGDGGK